jgi:hypothetical protein
MDSFINPSVESSRGQPVLGLRKASGTFGQGPEATLPSAQDEVIVALRYACETAALIIKFWPSPQRR